MKNLQNCWLAKSLMMNHSAENFVMICISNFGILLGVWSSDFSFQGNCGAVNRGNFFIKQVKGQISIVIPYDLRVIILHGSGKLMSV